MNCVIVLLLRACLFVWACWSRMWECERHVQASPRQGQIRGNPDVTALWLPCPFQICNRWHVQPGFVGYIRGWHLMMLKNKGEMMGRFWFWIKLPLTHFLIHNGWYIQPDVLCPVCHIPYEYSCPFYFLKSAFVQMACVAAYSKENHHRM